MSPARAVRSFLIHLLSPLLLRIAVAILLGAIYGPTGKLRFFNRLSEKVIDGVKHSDTFQLNGGHTT